MTRNFTEEPVTAPLGKDSHQNDFRGRRGAGAEEHSSTRETSSSR